MRSPGRVDDTLVWLDRAALSALLTEELRKVAGCEHASIVVRAGPRRRSGREQLARIHVRGAATSQSLLVRAVAGGVVSEARERYSMLDD